MSSAETRPEFSTSTKKFYPGPSTEPSTREPSPAPDFRYTDYEKADLNGRSIEESLGIASPGVLPDEAYDSALVWWRAGFRKLLVRNLKRESHWVATLQFWIRNGWLDTYFIYTSALGTHTFFLMMIPALYFLGHEKIGLGSLTILGMGGYCSSFMKDLFCTPRPFSPPVTRLTIGNHHMEYGFPSTHSANSASVALYLHTLMYRLYVSGNISSISLHLAQGALAWYIFSIVFGRLYCGMHSFTDCVVGVLLGFAVCSAYLTFENQVQNWLSTSGWPVPLVLVSLAIPMINQHPQPVDDCPCFEDAIAFVSSILGGMLGQWHAAYFGWHYSKFWTGLAPGKDWDLWTLWLTFAGLRLFFGVLSIFLWRLAAKAFFHTVLPPIFRFAGSIFTLPSRRFYTPATDYESVPTRSGLHPIPSVIDLHHSPTAVMAKASATLPRVRGDGLKLRNGGIAGLKSPGWKASNALSGMVVDSSDDGIHERDGSRKHYDADVLTKVMVYTGIGMIASEWALVLFDFLGWTVVSR